MSRFSEGLRKIAPPEPIKPTPKKAEGQGRELPPSRQGKRGVTAYFDPAVRQQLAILAAETDQTQQALMTEALNLMFQRYGKPPIA